MSIEFDDNSLRVYGNNYPALKFYDDNRTLRQEIYLTAGNVLNIGNYGTFTTPADGGGGVLEGGGTSISGGRGILVSGSDSYVISLNENIDATWTAAHTFEDLITASAGIDVATNEHIGISDSEERIEFDAANSDIELLGADHILVNLQASNGGRVEILSTTEQLRLDHDAANYASFTVGAGGSLTIAPTGDLYLNPTGNDVLPTASYDINLGSLSYKYLTLHAAELWVETLVAQETLATFGGRVLVGPTTEVTRDLAAGGATIYVKHNQMRSGDRVYLEANGSVEFLAITSAHTAEGAGDYSYSITRNLDGTGANAWPAGSAVFNTGQAGNGFIDMYSLWSLSARPLEYIYSFDFGPNTYSDNQATEQNFELFSEGVDSTSDSMYFGIVGTTWENLHFNIGVAADYVGTLTWRYWDGAAWTTFVPDTTTDFKSTGNISVTWSVADIADWDTTSVNGVTAYWIRCICTSFTSWTTSPTQIERPIRRGDNNWGPTIVGNVRQSATYNDWEPRWAIGNMNGLYGIANDYYGIGLGDYTSGDYLRYDENGGFILSAGGGNTTIDDQGIRLYSAAAGAAGRRVDMMFVDSGSTYTIGTLYSAYDSGDPNDEAFTWLVAYHGAGDPWTHPRITLDAYDSDAGEEAWVDIRTTTFEHVNVGPDLTIAGAVYVGGETEPNELTYGVVIDQGASDDEIIIGVSSDVSHGMTTIIETDAYFSISKQAGADGGVLIRGLTDATIGVEIVGYVTSVDTTKSTAGIGAVNIAPRLKDGTGVQDMSADANLVSIRNRNTTRFIFDAEGSLHCDVEATTFDEQNDVELLRELEEELREWKGENRHAEGRAEGRKKLEDLGLVTFDEENEGHLMLNQTKLLWLLSGAIRQVDARARAQ